MHEARQQSAPPARARKPTKAQLEKEKKQQVYCAVLKEQIAEIKTQMRFMMGQPQYSVLHRFANRLMGYIPNPAYIQSDLREELGRHQGMLAVLQNGGAESAGMINRWADDHARSMREDAFLF